MAPGRFQPLGSIKQFLYSLPNTSLSFRQKACSTVLLTSLAISGCASQSHMTDAVYPPTQAELEQDWQQIEITSHDGTLLTATLYQPKLGANESAPLIIHTHGFGGSRAPRPLSLYGTMIISGEAALEAWRAGYWVLSYDQRGFGSSGGDIQLMDPDFEVKDMISVIDWAEKHLPRVDKDDKGDIKLGTIGESYGGGVQLLTSLQDPRIDALVPITTWYNLEHSMAPNGHIKGAWGSALVSLGSLSSGFDFPMLLEDDYFDLIGGSMNAQVSEDLKRRSPATYCAQGQSIQGDALFIQGFRDTLFPLNEGIQNWQCARLGGRDAQLVGIQDGHILPWPTQSWSGMPLFNTQESVTCGDYQAKTTDMIVHWWDKKLRRINHEQTLPNVCLTYSDTDGVALTDLPMAGDRIGIRETEIKLMQSGWAESVLQPMEWLADMILPTQTAEPVEQQPTLGGGLRPAFIPLSVVDSERELIGVPKVSIEFQTTDSDGEGTAYIGLGIKRAGSPLIEVIDEQFTPLPRSGTYQMDLPAVSRKLKANETIGLVVQGFTGQYFLDPEGWFDFATLKGDIQLPIHNPGSQNTLMTQSQP